MEQKGGVCWVYFAPLVDPVLRFATRSSKNRTAASVDTEEILSILSFCEQARLPEFMETTGTPKPVESHGWHPPRKKVHVCVRLCFCVSLILPVLPPQGRHEIVSCVSIESD